MADLEKSAGNKIKTVKTAVILFNLGGPDSLSSVKPFLFNLFYDKAIIRLPNPLRFLVAWLITMLRQKKSRAIYAKIGGSSPIYGISVRQAQELEELLNHQVYEKNNENPEQFRVFVSMRYWHPLIKETIREVKFYAPAQIILLPLYPQFSTTTTGSSFAEWNRIAAKMGLDKPTKSICCYFNENEFIETHARMIREAYRQARAEYISGKPRILFSAHGLPESIIEAGDPYQFQIQETVKRVIRRMVEMSVIWEKPEAAPGPEGQISEPAAPRILHQEEYDYAVCYQSRVGPKQWLGPSTIEMIAKAGQEKAPLLIVPVSFVSEHSETLVELDIDYKKIAESSGVPHYSRVPALSLEPGYIKSLAGLVDLVKGSTRKTCSAKETRLCPGKFSGCPNR